VDLLGDPFEIAFGGTALYIGYLIFFFGVGLMLTLRLVQANGYFVHGALALSGLLATIFMIVALAYACANWENAFGGHAVTNNEGISGLVIFPIVVQMIVFGLFPLVLGARRLLQHYVNHAAKD